MALRSRWDSSTPPPPFPRISPTSSSTRSSSSSSSSSSVSTPPSAGASLASPCYPTSFKTGGASFCSRHVHSIYPFRPAPRFSSSWAARAWRNVEVAYWGRSQRAWEPPPPWALPSPTNVIVVRNVPAIRQSPFRSQPCTRAFGTSPSCGTQTRPRTSSGRGRILLPMRLGWAPRCWRLRRWGS